MKSLKCAPLSGLGSQFKSIVRRISFGAAMLFAFGAALFGQNTGAKALPPGGINLQVVSFGDSLSDVGTYSSFAGPAFGGGRFTTNPGQIWTELVAEYYGGTLQPAFLGGFGMPLQPAGGFGYGQGGSRVKLQPGVGHAAAGTPNADFAAATTIPVTQQVDEYLATYGKFNSGQLVLINGGPDDVLFNLQNVESNPSDLASALFAIDQSAVDLAAVVDKVFANGAKHVVLLDIADFGSSPEGVTTGESRLITEAVKTFNATLRATLFVRGLLNKVILVDEFSFLDQVVANFQSFGFTTSDTGSACNSAAEIAIATGLGLPDPAGFNDSLFCSPKTLVAPNADQTFIFADTVHPTTHYSALFARFVEQQIAASGLGK